MEMDWRAFTPEDSPLTPEDLVRDPHVVDLATPKVTVGDEAVDFELPVHDFSDGTAKATGATMRLSDETRDRPVALVFGSYT